ncbi:MAG: hypothetical protein ACWGSQ_00120 [Longimicrobiales bacterium]
MKQKHLLKVWRVFLDWKVEGHGGRSQRTLPGHAIRPLPVAVRLDTVLQTGANRTIPVSKLVWVSPSAHGLPVAALEANLVQN